LPIDFLEFGVFEGESIFKWAELNQNHNSRFFGFDTFTGLPEAWSEKHHKGYFSVNGKIPHTDDKRIIFLKGLFQKTLPDFLSKLTLKNRLIINMDADLYSSTLYCLTKIDYLLPQDSILIFDEFNNLSHEFSAYLDYTNSYNRKMELICSTSNYHKVAFLVK